MKTAVDQVHELNDAVCAKDVVRFVEGMHPDAVEVVRKIVAAFGDREQRYLDREEALSHVR